MGKYKKLLSFVCLGLSVIILPIIFYAMLKDTREEAWLGFWANYTGGVCTLIAIMITISFQSSNIMHQFERDIDLRRFEKFEDAFISFKIFMLSINPKFEKYDDKIVFNYEQIKNEMYKKYNLFKHCYYSITPVMDREINKYFQKTVKSYISYLDQLKKTAFINLSDAETLLKKLNDEYEEEYAQRNKHFFLQLRKEVTLYLKNKSNSEAII